MATAIILVNKRNANRLLMIRISYSSFIMQQKYILLVAFSIGAIITYGQNTTATYNVRDFGAIANGTNLDSKVINRAIDTIVSKGSGTLIFPAGDLLYPDLSG